MGAGVARYRSGSPAPCCDGAAATSRRSFEPRAGPDMESRPPCLQHALASAKAPGAFDKVLGFHPLRRRARLCPISTGIGAVPGLVVPTLAHFMQRHRAPDEPLACQAQTMCDWRSRAIGHPLWQWDSEERAHAASPSVG